MTFRSTSSAWRTSSSFSRLNLAENERDRIHVETVEQTLVWKQETEQFYHHLVLGRFRPSFVSTEEPLSTFFLPDWPAIVRHQRESTINECSARNQREFVYTRFDILFEQMRDRVDDTSVWFSLFANLRRAQQRVGCLTTHWTLEIHERDLASFLLYQCEQSLCFQRTRETHLMSFQILLVAR